MSGSRVIHSDDLPWETGGHGDLYGHRRRRLAREANGRGLGCSMMELDPGRTAWPFHYHHANEEALYVLSGEAMLRLGTQRFQVRAGDYVALPPGPDHAHQLTNTSSEVVRYLVMSTMVTPDVCVYPDSNKVGVVGALSDARGQPRRVVTFPLDAEVGYWDEDRSAAASAGPEPRTTGEAASPPSNQAARERASTRRTTLEAMVEADLEALKRKLERSELGQEDLDALKRKLGRDD